MGWLNFLENSFGTKDKDRRPDKGKPGKLRPGRFESNLIESARRKKIKIDEPLDFFEKRISDTRSRDRKRRVRSAIKNLGHINEEKNDKLKEILKKKNESAFERLIRMRYLSKDLKTRERQIQSLSGWISYLKTLPGPDTDHKYHWKFEYYVLRSILKYDLYWLDKNEDGSWKTGIRNKSTKKEFPNFDPDLTPEILAKIKEIVSDYNSSLSARRQIVRETYSPSILDALKSADFRELYFLIKEQIEFSRLKDEDMESKEGEGWVPVFSFKDCKSEDDKKKVAQSLAKATEFSRGFCLKSEMKAREYLDVGDIYLYNTKVKIKAKEGNLERVVDVPEIAIHIFRGGEREGEINPNEIHGNDVNQGINKEYLSIARKFIAESDFKNKGEFAMRFADAEFIENLREKVKNGEDFNPRDLKFIYRVYRQVETFEINNEEKKFLDNLKLKRNPIKDYIKMFEVSLEEMAMGPGDINEKTKIFIGNLYVNEFFDFQNIEEVTGGLFFRFNFKKGEQPKNVKSLKKVGGVIVTDEDVDRILTGGGALFLRVQTQDFLGAEIQE